MPSFEFYDTFGMLVGHSKKIHRWHLPKVLFWEVFEGPGNKSGTIGEVGELFEHMLLSIIIVIFAVIILIILVIVATSKCYY